LPVLPGCGKEQNLFNQARKLARLPFDGCSILDDLLLASTTP